MSKSTMKESKAHNRGVEDGKKGSYNPPDGTSWGSVIGSSIFGETGENRSYREGYDKGKKRQ